MKNTAKKAVSEAMREKVEEVLPALKNYQNWLFRLSKGLNIYGKEIEGGSDDNLCFSEKERSKIWIMWKESRMRNMIEIVMCSKMR